MDTDKTITFEIRQRNAGGELTATLRAESVEDAAFHYARRVHGAWAKRVTGEGGKSGVFGVYQRLAGVASLVTEVHVRQA